MHIFRWDLDRTYLDTDIRSVRGMLRSAFEAASDKRTIPGADVLLRQLLAHDPDTTARIVSGSPIQMRAVLEEKLTLDGIRFDQIVLKDNLRNITRGRFRALRGQLGYKLPALLAARRRCAPDDTESLFGDDAEVDALVYALYADALAGRLDEGTLLSLFRAGHAYDDQVERAMKALDDLPRGEVVQDIWILVDRGLPLSTFHGLGPHVHVVFSWFQAALGLWSRGRLDPPALDVVADRVAPEVGRAHALAGWTQDAVRRGIVTPDAVDALLDEGALAGDAPRVREAVQLLGPPPAAPTSSEARDYLAFLTASESHR